MNLSKLDLKHIFYITLYSLIFLIIRLLASVDSMTNDEAEQFLDASSYQLGYLDQPPLYSWLTKSFSLVFGMNVPMMIILYHLIAFSFVLSLYFMLKEIWQEKYAWLILLSFLFFFIFSYDFYRYTIHTALASLFCALSLWTYLRLYKYRKTSDYLLLGLFCGLGLISKYNFLFFLIVLLLASLSTKAAKEVLFDYRANLSVLLCLLVFAPHFYWLYENNFPSITYAMNRGDAGDSSINYLPVLLNGYWNVLVYLGVFLLFFSKDFSFKHLKDEPFFRTIRFMGFFSLLVPLFTIIVLQAGNFSQRWMAPLNIFIPLALFSFVEFKGKSIRYKYFYVVAIVLVFALYSFRIASYFFPDKFGPSFINKPYRKIYSNLDQSFNDYGIEINDIEFIAFKEISLLGGIKSFYPNVQTKILRNKSKLKSDPEKLKIIFWDNAKDQDFRKVLSDRKENYQILFTKSAQYLYSRELEPFQVNFAKYLVE